MRDGISVRYIPPVEERFWSRVDFTESCWVFTGFRDKGGYGRFTIGKKTHFAHRWAYEYLIGDIPSGLQIDHLCRNRGCVNVFHMEPVTSRENTRRGNAISVRMAAKTHCVRGHSLTDPGNLTPYGKRHGWRLCMACPRIYVQEHRARARLAAMKEVHGGA
jgi:hypothetical protein